MNKMINKRPFSLTTIITIEIIHIVACISFGIYFRVPSSGWPHIYLFLILITPLIIYLLSSYSKISWILGITTLSLLVLGNFIIIIGADLKDNLFNIYAILPVMLILLTLIKKRWVWITFLVFHIILFISALYWAIFYLPTGYEDVVCSFFIILLLLKRDTKLYFNNK